MSHADIHDPSDNFQVGVPGGEDFEERLQMLCRYVAMMNQNDWHDWRVHCYDKAGDVNVLLMEEILGR